MGNLVPIAVVTGGHSFDVPGFHRLFRSIPGLDPYIQHMDDFFSASPADRASYAAVVFYMMPIPTPRDEAMEWFMGRPTEVLQSLAGTGQGIVILHHGLTAYREWDLWKSITGLMRTSFSYHPGEKVAIEAADPAHPITRGLEPWEMTDETYLMDDAGEGSRFLFSTSNAHSMRHVGWTREFGKARVFCFQPGHDARAWSSPEIREVLRRGILWSAQRI
jgi:hypothetical protein